MYLIGYWRYEEILSFLFFLKRRNGGICQRTIKKTKKNSKKNRGKVSMQRPKNDPTRSIAERHSCLVSTLVATATSSVATSVVTSTSSSVAASIAATTSSPVVGEAGTHSSTITTAIVAAVATTRPTFKVASAETPETSAASTKPGKFIWGTVFAFKKKIREQRKWKSHIWLLKRKRKKNKVNKGSTTVPEKWDKTFLQLIWFRFYLTHKHTHPFVMPWDVKTAICSLNQFLFYQLLWHTSNKTFASRLNTNLNLVSTFLMPINSMHISPEVFFFFCSRATWSTRLETKRHSLWGDMWGKNNG